MAELSITAANVLKGTNGVEEAGTAAETITAGALVYRAADGLIYKTDADSATVAARTPRGVALNGASAGQPIDIQLRGDITIGATLTAGLTYYVSGATAGAICVLADVGATEYLCIVGIAKSTSVLSLGFNYSGVLGA